MKTGILGGTFNPIHIAHIYLAKKYYEMLGLDKVIFIPTFIPPHKSAENVVDAQERLDMCRLALKKHPEFEVSDYEIIERGKSYTYLTLEYLRRAYPDDDFFLLMGSDMFLTMQDWVNPTEIFRLATLCAAKRDFGEDSVMEIQAEKLRQMGARCEILHIEPLPLSSTEIREKIAAGEDATNLLDPDVWLYIKERGLYGAK